MLLQSLERLLLKCANKHFKDKLEIFALKLQKQLEVGITYNRMLCNYFTGPARFR